MGARWASVLHKAAAPHSIHLVGAGEDRWRDTVRNPHVRHDSPGRSGAAIGELILLYSHQRGYLSAPRSASGCTERGDTAFNSGLIMANGTVMLLFQAAARRQTPACCAASMRSTVARAGGDRGVGPDIAGMLPGAGPSDTCCRAVCTWRRGPCARLLQP